MQASNRSGLQCMEHPREQFTNFCVNIDCLKPLCPDCVQIHTKTHQIQQIQSWKHCLNKNAMKMRTTLEELRALYDSQRNMRANKTIQTIEAENMQRLSALRERYHRMVDEIFNTHEQALRMQIRQHYKFDAPDTTKLRTAIEQIQKVIMKLAHPASALPALKKALLLDTQSLLSFFGHLRNHRPAQPQEQFFTQNGQTAASIRSLLERAIALDGIMTMPVQIGQLSRRYSNHMSVGDYSDPFEPLKVTANDYFRHDCKHKLLHFFVPCSFQVKFMRLDELDRPQWKTVEFKARKELPCYFKSIATPTGDIYLTGGSQQDLRCRQIYKYNFQKNSLDLVCNMLIERSSHSICYLDNKIYLIGGFSSPDGEVTRDCQVLDLQTMSCSRIAPLNTPSANSAAATFSQHLIFKMGGIFNRNEGNSLIQMYSTRNNRWIVVNIESAQGVPPLQLLSFSAGVQINDRDLLIFGGYDNSEQEKPQRVCYALTVLPEKNVVRVLNYNTNPLPYAQGFWNNTPIIHQRRVVALQNVTDQDNELTALADQRRVVVFNGERWL